VFVRLKSIVILVAGFVLLSGGAALAHHGTAAYDTTKTVTVKATMTEFDFTNPHCELYFEVKGENGAVEKWQGELTAPNKLARAGWSKNTLKPGDSVTISGYRTKSGSNVLWIRSLVGPDGNNLPLSENQD
jgi:hypothetical protein